MSLEEHIAILESEKRACIEHFDAAIANLWNLKQTQRELASTTATLPPDATEFRPFRIKGKPLSQTILEDRGVY